jgi:phenylalanyl-tRNA synthetase beta subunit
LQQEERVWKGKRQGPYKIPREFEKALREKGLIFDRLPEGTKEMMLKKLYERPEGTTTNEAVEETTQKAVMALFERIAERRREKDRTRKAKN